VLLTVDEAVFWVTTTHGGHGVHIWNLHLGTVFKILYVGSSTQKTRKGCHRANPGPKWLNVTAIVYTPAEFLIRLSILLQFLRIFIPHQREDKFTFYTIHGLIWCNGLFYLIKFIGLLALCVPRKKLWEPVRYKYIPLLPASPFSLFSSIDFASDISAGYEIPQSRIVTMMEEADCVHFTSGHLVATATMPTHGS